MTNAYSMRNLPISEIKTILFITGILHFRLMRDSIVYLYSEGRKFALKVDLDTSASRLKEIVNVLVLRRLIS